MSAAEDEYALSTHSLTGSLWGARRPAWPLAGPGQCSSAVGQQSAGMWRGPPASAVPMGHASVMTWQEERFGENARYWDHRVSARGKFGSGCEHGTTDGRWPGKAGEGLPVCDCGWPWYRLRLRSQGQAPA